MKEYDIIVVGAGRASNLARNAGKAGKKIAIIEKSKFGGTCPNRGCVPSKLLIGYAEVARSSKEASRHFIDAQINHIDVEKIFEDTNAYIDTIDPAYRSRFNENVETYTGEASFVSNYVVEVNGEQLTAPKIVIATGTRPIAPPHEKAWTSDDIFPLVGKVPKSITIVGAGFIACELANFFDAVGIETKLLARSQHILKNEDDEILAFYDINPQSDTHFLVVPKQHISGADKITGENSAVVAHIFEVISSLTKQLGLSSYRIINNCGEGAGQTVMHLHFHVLSGGNLGERLV